MPKLIAALVGISAALIVLNGCSDRGQAPCPVGETSNFTLFG